MRVLIFGCGPAGLMAAHAANEMDADFVIMSRKRKSPMRGAQYLHSRIPGIPAYEFKITYTLVGTVEGYRQKVYGEDSDIQVSPQKLMGVSKAYDIRAAYNGLWKRYGNSVRPWEAGSNGIVEAIDLVNPDLVISTIPAFALCWGGCRFDSAAVLVSEEARQIEKGRNNLVVCSGIPEHQWYRQSRIHGWENTEYPYRTLVGRRHDVVLVRKPISTDCKCWPQIVRMGRYGRWEKGVLSDSAYKETKELIRNADR